MGTIMTVGCNNCGFEKELYTGVGRSDCSLETIMAALTEVDQKMLSEAAQHGATRISIDRIPCSCTSCGEIYAVPIVSYFMNGEEHTICGVCPSCQQKNYSTLNGCPGCKSELSVRKTGLWD
ncbi:MAG: hypothetical protein J6A05_05430 [Oscillospiraceae bacterium]|nr:hypothetical protein [Oscillospiraceae bacterium]